MRNKNSREPRLTPEDIEYLMHNTRYDEKEIREWFRWEAISTFIMKLALYSCSGFVSVCPLGQLTMENIYDMYAMPKHRSAVRKFDSKLKGVRNYVYVSEQRFSLIRSSNCLTKTTQGS